MSQALHRQAIKAGLWYTASNFLTRALSAITMPIFTRLLTKTEYGAFANFTSWMGLLTVLTTLDLYSSIQRAYFDFQDDLDAYLSSILLMGASVTAVCYLGVVCFRDLAEDVFRMPMSYIHLMFTGILVAPALQFIQIKHRFMMKYKLVSLLSLLSALAMVGVSIALASLMQDRLLGRVIGYTVPMIAINLVLCAYILWKGRRFCWQYCKYAAAISIPLIPHLLGNNILGDTDRILINRFYGPDDTALYNVIYNCSTMITILLMSLNQTWVPWLFAHLHAEDYEPVRRFHKPFIVSFCLLALLIMLCAPEIILILAGEAYMRSIYMMPPIMMGLVCSFMYTLFVNTEIYHKKTMGISVRTLLAALFNLVLNLLLLRPLGYIIAAYTTLAGYLLLLVLHYFAAKNLGVQSYYSCKFIFLATAVMAAASGAVLATYAWPTVRYACLAAYLCALCAAGYKNRVFLAGLWGVLRKRA
ncbi:MAG: oligosaccharide flippase family protein [Oscillospiraceae bacterium]|jgi:O-antigen/teichoic acid export membrane protein|nr:oligosaccharide flippase family protein [Oscillospiraceae bacterium]